MKALVLLFIFSLSWAKIPTLEKKYWTNKEGWSRPSLSLNGFSISSKLYPENVNCKSFNNTIFKIQLLLNRDPQYNDIILKCRSSIQDDFLTIWFIKQENLKNKESLKKYLLKNNHKNISKIINIFQIKNKANTTAPKLLLLLKDISELLLQKNCSKNFSKCTKLQSMASNEKRRFIKKMLNLVLALKSNNHSWLKNTILEIINLDKEEIIFEIPPLFSRPGVTINKYFIDSTVLLLNEVKGNLNDKFIFKLFVTFLDELLQHERIKEEFDITWSLREIRQTIDSPVYGKSLPSLWYPILKNRLTIPVEVSEYLKKATGRFDFFSDFPSKLWILTEYLPTDSQFQHDLLKKMRSLHDSTNWYKRYLFLQLLEHNLNLKDKLASKKEKLKRPLVLLKRDFYLELLNSGEATQFAVANLIDLGDIDPSFLWWIGI